MGDCLVQLHRMARVNLGARSTMIIDPKFLAPPGPNSVSIRQWNRLAFSKIDQQHTFYENGCSSLDSLQDIGGNVQQRVRRGNSIAFW